MGQRYAVVLAAGKGTRMKSRLPKVLHHVCGKPMLQHIVDLLVKLKVDEIVVVIGHGSEQVRSAIHGNVTFVEQKEQLGTAHAVMQSESILQAREGSTIVMNGDSPLFTLETLQSIFESQERSGAGGTLLTSEMKNPTGYGRIIRNETGDVLKVVEDKDADNQERKIKEINTGTYCFDNQKLFDAIHQVDNNNTQKEYYITDLIEIFRKNDRLQVCQVEDEAETLGINDRLALSQAESIMRKRINEYWMLGGVTLIAPEQTHIGTDVKIGLDTVIYPGVSIRGESIIGEGCIIGNGSQIVDSEIGDEVTIQHSVIVESKIHHHVMIGPFAYLRPGSEIDSHVKIGDFVEIKNTKVGEGSKIPHLSYVGDAVLGKDVNMGCGSITVNYDGVNKHKTIIEDEAFIGCNTNLVAPIHIGKAAYTAAGSTITRDVPANALSIARNKQTNKEDYVDKIKRKK